MHGRSFEEFPSPLQPISKAALILSLANLNVGRQHEATTPYLLAADLKQLTNERIAGMDNDQQPPPALPEAPDAEKMDQVRFNLLPFNSKWLTVMHYRFDGDDSRSCPVYQIQRVHNKHRETP
jgi:hypothetical protein